MILTDDESKNPVLDFKDFSDAIVKIIIKSHPKFSIGIFGEWGTGKTTLMKQIETKLESDKSIVTVWFDAWRYEREGHLAIVPMLKTIAYALPEAKEFNGLRESIKKGFGVIRREIPEIATSVTADFVSKSLGRNTETVTKELKKKLLPRLELLAEVNEKDTIYFKGIENIELELNKVRQRDTSKRVVVFIDDLDRCSPSKMLEVFESIKVFLDITGIIYVIGISHETISKLITLQYGATSGITGEAYIRKMIQIPISLPRWNTDDISILLKNLIKQDVPEEYKKIIDDNKYLISRVAENNPRELKRFINNFIVSYEIFSRHKSIKPRQLLMVRALQSRWNNLYYLLTGYGTTYGEQIRKYCNMTQAERNQKLESSEPDPDFSPEIKTTLRNMKIDEDLWKVLRENEGPIFSIKDWEMYRRAVETSIYSYYDFGEGVLYDYYDMRKLITEIENIIQLLKPSSVDTLRGASEKLTELMNKADYVLGKKLNKDTIIEATKYINSLSEQINILDSNIYLDEEMLNTVTRDKISKINSGLGEASRGIGHLMILPLREEHEKFVEETRQDTL